ncbi:MAG: cytochrome d ubiquinol oxidase subunit II [Sutterellaceae bacterium]|nr:cytochrome d ubiquinol oxidase subunit II [Sutterellaceae bacterium]
MIDYEILRAIWWLFIGVLLVGFAIMDGHDMGVGTLLPFLGKNDTERRCMINSVAPHWDGNQVWLITGGGAIFAAWPLVYATAFSGFYWAMLVVLMALIFRPVGFDYRGKVSDPRWRNAWDWALFVGSAVPPIIFGVAFGNLLQGVPFHFDDSLRPIYTGNFFGLLNPFGLLCGVVSLLMIVFHGANYLVLRTEGDLQRRAVTISTLAGIATAVLFVLGGVWAYFGLDGLVVSAGLDPAGPSNPLFKTVDVYAGAWFTNFYNYPVLWLVPALGVLGALASVFFVKQMKAGFAIVSSSVMLLGIVLTPLLAMFPFIMPSSTDPRSSLTIWDCTSSQLTLQIMLVVTLIFLPIVLVYTGWAYKVMSGKLNAEYIKKNDHHLY